MRRILLAFIAAVVALVWVGRQLQRPEPARPLAIASYAYDAQHYDDAPDCTDPVRGRPSTTCDGNATAVVDSVSHGAPARPSDTSTPRRR